jgi:hypothetical protein
MNRDGIYQVIDGEREYQRKVWGQKGERRVNNGVPGETETHPVVWPDGRVTQEVNHSVGNWIVFMEHYLGLAKAELTLKDGHTAALEMMRKVVALGVACFEEHGVPPRAV